MMMNKHQNNSHQFFEFIFNQIWWISILTSASFSAHFTSGIKILKNWTYWDIFRLFWNKPKNKRSCNFAFSSSRSYKIEFISDILILVLLFLFPLYFVIYIFISVKNSQTDWVLIEPMKKCMYQKRTVKYVEIAKNAFMWATFELVEKKKSTKKFTFNISFSISLPTTIPMWWENYIYVRQFLSVVGVWKEKHLIWKVQWIGLFSKRFEKFESF